MTSDDEFDGLMEIAHHSKAKDKKPTEPANDDFLAPQEEAAEVAASPNTELLARIEKLEADFATYVETNEKKLAIIEKIAEKQQLTAQERVFMIQEEA